MRLRSLAPLVVAVLALAGCGGGGSDSSGSTSTSVASSTTKPPASSTTAPARKLKILVTNDDGYQAEGIDALVEGLATLDDVELTVYAPLAQQSGQGGKSTDGPVKVTDVTLASGHAARAVDGFPADTVRVAMDEEGVKPDVVVSGINQGQNLGPLVDISGTVGAARAAVRRGVPGMAVSQGSGGFDYPAAVPLVLDWIRQHHAALVAGTAPDEVTNLNVPSCDIGKVRGLAEVPADLKGDVGKALGVQDCASTEPLATLKADVAAFVAGYATIDVIPNEPATPAEVVPAGA